MAVFRPVLAGLLPVGEAAVEPAAGRSPLVLAEGMLRLLATVGPAVVVIEDLHWADGDTLAVVEYLLDHAADAPVVVVVTVRPEPGTAATTLVDGAVGRRAVELIEIGPLGRTDAAALVTHCLDDGARLQPQYRRPHGKRRNAFGRLEFDRLLLRGRRDE